MPRSSSKILPKTRKTTDSDELELRFVECPPEQRESYWQAMRILHKYLMQAVEEQRLAISGQRLADEHRLERFQVNNRTESQKLSRLMQFRTPQTNPSDDL